MNQTKFLFVLFVLFAFLSNSYAGDFIDTRITWTFGDDDIFRSAGEVVPDTPKPSIGDRKGYELFMDNLNIRYTGRENQTHLVMYKKMQGFFKKLITEAAMVLQFDFAVLEAESDPKIGDAIMDDGSYLKINYIFNEQNEEEGVFFTFFPFDTERFRIGYLWDISWGGGGIFSTRRSGPAPGFKLDLKSGIFDCFLGFKTTKVSQTIKLGVGGEAEEISVQESNYGFLAGGGLNITEWLRWDIAGGYFDQGTFNFEGLVGKKVYTFGFSSRLSLMKGIPPSTSVDYLLYRNDPAVAIEEWKVEEYLPKLFSWRLSIEGSILMQHLKDAEKFGTTKLQPAYSGALQLNLKYSYFRALLSALYRNVEFILHNVPSLTPFVSISEGAITEPEYFFAASFDYHFPKIHLTPALTGGVQFPATFKSSKDAAVQVIRDEGRRDRLPIGFDALPIYSFRLSAQWDISKIMSLIGLIQFVHDENLTRLKIDAEGERRVFIGANQFGFALITRAKF